MNGKVRSTLMAIGRILLFVALLVLPAVARVGYYYRRPYAAPDVPRPDLSDVDVPEVDIVAFADVDVRPGTGQVLIDRAHGNVVDDAELNVLLARLTARGMDARSLTPDDTLPIALRTASALVVISPHQAFSAYEVAAVERFVEQGGRVLLAADPSRYSYELEEDDLYGELYVVRSDVAATNSLASAFGLAFADDYLYNAKQNGGNYQYVILRDFAESAVTAGLEEVIFYAAHSLTASKEPLVTADEDTTSSLNEQSGGLVTVGLGGDGRVLAVADFTFMTEPYNVVADNDRLIANIADFVAGAERTFGLSEFPHFFGGEVDLVSVLIRQDVALSADAIEEASRLQAAFELGDKTLYWRTEPGGAHDTFYLGLYNGLTFWPEVGEILAREGISFTLDTAERELAALTPTPTATQTPTRRFTPTPTPTPEVSPTPTPTPRPLRDWISLPGFGKIDAKETALLYQNEENGRQVLIVLAFGEAGLQSAVDRLLWGDFTDCLIDEDRKGDPKVVGLALCPTDYAPATEEPTPMPTTAPDDIDATSTPTPSAMGSVLIVSDDDGEAVYEWWTSAYQFYDIVLEAGYEAVVWSTDFDGEITLDLLEAYDAVLWCTGDYQEEGNNPSEEELDMLGEYMDQGGGLLLMGAFLGDPEDRETGLLLDIQVVQVDHPLADSFEADQIITLERFTAEEDYAPYVATDLDPEAVIWARGPESEFAGEAVVAALEDDSSGSRLVVSGVPLYLLPYDLGTAFGTNVFLWLVHQ